MLKKGLFLFFITLSALTLGACGSSSSSSDDDSNSTRNYMGTQTPGDIWSWTITTDLVGSGTFSASNDTLGNTYSGTVVTLANGFLKLTVTATSGPGPAFIPEYALEFPGTALIIKPAGTGDAIVAVALGDCPTASATYNWVDLLELGWVVATDQAYGVSDSTVTGSGSNFDFSHTNYRLDGTPLAPEIATGFTCSGGIITHPTDPTVIVATPSGAFIGDKGLGAGGMVGMQAPSSDIVWSDVVLAGREYRGVIFEDGNLDEDPTRPVWARPDGLGGLTGGQWDNFEANVENTTITDTVTVTFDDQNSPGVVEALVTDSSGTTNMVLMINIINGKYFIYGAHENSFYSIGANFLLIEQ